VDNLNIPEQYIQDVLNNKIVVGKLVRLACERHHNDLATGHLRNLKFNPQQGLRVIQFVESFCCHLRGELEGQPIKLEPWQQAMLYILYGWRWADTGFRRFRIAYCECGKGNGKSTWASALALYELIGVGEAGSEVYSVAVDKTQAKVVFDDAVLMVKKSPALAKRIKSHTNNLHVPGTASKFQPLAANYGSLEGKRPQAFVADELHAWGYGAEVMWTGLVNALGKRDSPILIVITTAGSGEESVCKRQHAYSEKVLTGTLQADDWFAWVCCLDEGDSYDDPSMWIKANPNLGVSVRERDLAALINQAMGDPASLNEVLRVRFGIWTQTSVAYFPMDEWAQCNEPIDLESLKNQPCFGGLDLSTTMDLSAFVLLFPPYGDRSKWVVLPHFFIPGDNIGKRCQRDRVPYDAWQRVGMLTATPGNVIDYDAVRLKIIELSETYDIREISYDPWNATETATWLQVRGFTVSPLRQGFPSLAGPTKRLLELVLKHDLTHLNNPILRWMASNVVVDTDPTGNVKPNKVKSAERIDGISALICALSRAMVVTISPKKKHFTPFVM
jgi:phage terminase large subunit-like protein